MRKKLIIGALGLASVFAVSSFAAEETNAENSNNSPNGRFFGTACHTEQTGAGKSSTICCYYVFWVATGCHEAG